MLLCPSVSVRCGTPEARELLAEAVSNKGPERGRKPSSALEEGATHSGADGSGSQSEDVSVGASKASNYHESEGLAGAALRRSSSSAIGSSSAQSEPDDDGDGPE